MSSSKTPANSMPTKASEPHAAPPKRFFSDNEFRTMQMYFHRLSKFGDLMNSKASWVEDAKAAYLWCLDHLRILVDDNLEAVIEKFRDQLKILNDLLDLDRKTVFPELEKAREAYRALHVRVGKGKVKEALKEAKKQVTSKDKVTAAAEVKAAPTGKKDQPKKAADRKPDPAAAKKTTAPPVTAAPAAPEAPTATEQKSAKAATGPREQKTTAAPASTPKQPQKIATEQRNAAVVKQQTPSAPRPSATTATTTTPTPPKSGSQPATKSSPTSVSPGNSAAFALFGAPVITTVFSCPPIPGEAAMPLPVNKKIAYTDSDMQTEHTHPNAQHKDKPKDKSAIDVVKSLSRDQARALLMQLDMFKLHGDVTINGLRQSLESNLGDKQAASVEGSGARVEKKSTAPKVTPASVPSTTPVARTAPRSTGTLAVTAAGANKTVATTATATTTAPGTTVRKVNNGMRSSNAAPKTDEARKRTVATEKRAPVNEAATVKATQQVSANYTDNDSDAPSRKRKRNPEKTSQAPGGLKRRCTQHVVDNSEDEEPESSERQKWKKPALPASIQDSRKRRRCEPEPESEEEVLSDLEEEPAKKRRTNDYVPRGFSQRPGPTQRSRQSGRRFTLAEDEASPLEMGGILDAIRRPNRQPPDLNAELAEKDRIGAKAKAGRKEEERRRRE